MDLITGGTGFLGRELASQLSSKGKKVRVFDLKDPQVLTERVEFKRGDIRDFADVMDACRAAETVYHLVGIVPQARASKSVMRTVNVGGTRNVVDACLKNGARRLVFVSSSEVYGFLEKVPCPETAITAPIGEYGVNKVAGELLCMEAMRRSALEVSIIRPTTIIGPYNWDSFFEMLFKLLDSNMPVPVPGKGDARWHVIHVEDAARALMLAGERDEAAGETFNLASSGDVPTHLEIALTLKKLAKSRARVVKINKNLAKWVLKVLCTFGLSPLEPDQFLVGFSDYVLDVSKIEKTLGWKSKFDSLGAFKANYDWYRSRLRSF